MKTHESITHFLKTFPQLIAIACIALASLTLFAFIVFCLVYFPQRTISTHPQDLGLYGDFIGGVVGTLISIATLGVTIYLAITLRKLEKENVSTAINAQKNVALMQLKFQELSLMKTNCDKAFDLWSDIDQEVWYLKDISFVKFEEYERRMVDLEKMIRSAILRMEVLFPELKKSKFGIRMPALIGGTQSYIQSIQDSFYSKETFGDTNNHFAQAEEFYYNLMKDLTQWALT